MWKFTGDLRFDSPSFWIGFLAGVSACILLWGIRKWLAQRRERQDKTTKTVIIDQSIADNLRLKNDTLLQAQNWHLAAAMFPLDEILIEPRLLAPPVSPASVSLATTDVTDWAIPYMPDWPEMASRLEAPTLSLAEALQGGCNLALIGPAGCGKSVALASLAIQLIRDATGLAEFAGFTPLLIHAGDLSLPAATTQDLLTPLLEAIAGYAAPATRKRLPDLLSRLLEKRRACLLLDGLDELPPSQVDLFVEYLAALRAGYPQVPMAVAASPQYVGGLYNLDFFPFVLTSWSYSRRLEFTRRWSQAWAELDLEPVKESTSAPDTWLLQGWLANEISPHSPLELTLRTWAAFAGDARGAKPGQAIEAHLHRLMASLPGRVRQAVENLALQTVRYMRPFVRREDAEAWLSGSQAAPTQVKGESLAMPPNPPKAPAIEKGAWAPGSLTGLIESGLLKAFTGGRVGFCHPALAGHLAGEALLRSADGIQLVLQPDWSGKLLALKRLCIQKQETELVDGMLKSGKEEILLRGLLVAARWLGEATEEAAWANRVMARLAACLQEEQLPYSLKARALSALVLSGRANVEVLLKQMLNSSRNELRQLAALGCGMLRDGRFSSAIEGLLSAGSPNTRSAAVLALVAIHDKAALNAIAEALLHGDESLRRACAEALSNDPDEGYSTLQEGSAHPDPLVRWAAVFGLRRIKLEWSKKLLEQIRDSDSQWVVQDAASQALSEWERADPHIPQPLPTLTRSDWLIGFAAEHNMAVPAGKAASDLIHRVLKEGSEEQVLSALYYLGLRGNESSIAPIYQVYLGSKGEKAEMALSALWYLASTGVSLPPPSYFGLG